MNAPIAPGPTNSIAGRSRRSSVTGASPGEILKPLAPFLIATAAILVLLAWQPYLVTALIQ